jgi:hypothetical protein
MCDFSAESVQRRDAKVGDRLVTAQISIHTVGLVSPSDPSTAVCMLPGTKMTVAIESAGIRAKLGITEPVTIATFAQRDVLGADGNYFRDGLVFENRQSDNDGIVLLNTLGSEAKVEIVIESIPGINDNPPPSAAAAKHEPVRELVDA